MRTDVKRRIYNSGSYGLMTNMQTEIIHNLGKLSDDVLDTKFAQACQDFDPEDQDGVIFLRNLLDLVVRYSAGSGFIVQIIMVVLENIPRETVAETEARRAKLLQAEGDPWNPAILNSK